MRSKNVVAAFFVAIGLGAGMATIAPATVHADPTDQLFVQVLGEKGIRLKPGVDAVKLAHSTCDLLAGGATPTDALKKVKDVTGLPNQETVTFGALAIYGYCKQYLPK